MKFNIKLRNFISDNFETIKHYYFPIVLGIISLVVTVVFIILGEKDLRTILVTIASLVMAVLTASYSYYKKKAKEFTDKLILKFFA